MSRRATGVGRHEPVGVARFGGADLVQRGQHITGQVEADIEAQTSIIAGHVIGNVQCTEKIELQAKCEMDGDLKTKSLVIEQGAVFCGACNMKGGTPDLGFLTPEHDSEEVIIVEDQDNS